MEDTRQKRAHRACEPCRRKKVKCEGERPTCSFCQRLRQPCDYGSSEQDQAQGAGQESRMQAIEMKLDQVLLSLGCSQIPASTMGASSISPTSRHLPDLPQVQENVPAQSHQEAISRRSEYHNILDAGQLYQTWCHNQPLCLFRQQEFLEKLPRRDRELQLAIQAISCRFPPGALAAERQYVLDSLSKACRKLVLDRVTDGKIRLSTLQSLCLLSMTCFANGDVMQAGLDLGMAHYFAGSLPPGSVLGDPLECSLCMQGISLLQCLQGTIPGAAKNSHAGSWFKDAYHLPGSLSYQATVSPLLREPSIGDTDSGILPYMFQASEVWHKARAYASSQVASDDPPPWDPRSDYSFVMLRNLELDCRFPLKYRFATSNFGSLSAEALQQRRDYWGPWLFIQFIHHAIPTLLNHPFLLSMRLKSFRHMMPQTFMHQCFDQISRHTAWTICFLDLVEKQHFQVSDPLIAHCVVIVATIHLQHSFVKDDTLRMKARNGFDKCMRFLDRMGSIWPSVSSMAQNLRQLQDSITTVPAPGSQANRRDGPPNESWSIDAQLLWNVLIYEKAGRHNASTDKSMFDDIIDLEAVRHDDVAEFAMVGSAGISGHKSAWKEISAYAPEDSGPHPHTHLPASSITSFPPVDPVADGSNVPDERLFEGFGDLDMMSQGDFLFQAEDFGRAINDWFNFNMADHP